MTSHRGTSAPDTPSGPPLKQALDQSEKVKEKVEDAAVDLSDVNDTLKEDGEGTVPLDKVKQALAKSEGVEAELKEAAEELVTVNEELTKEIAERDALEHRVRQGESAVSVSKAAEEEARHRALHDPITELPNITLFSDRLEQALEHADRHAWRLAVMFIDLNGFKEVNDRHGHDVGDRVLQEVAMRLTETVRAADSLARRGGDEFLVLALEVQDDDSISTLAHKLCERIGEPMDVDGTTINVSASIGIAVYPEDAMSAAALLKCADLAMYVAKREKTCVVRHATKTEGVS